MPAGPKPKQERSVAMRERLLDATLACLTELGYAGTTTLAVERQAQVSRGALLYHFPTRASLVSAAVEHLFEQLRHQYETSFSKLDRRADRIDSAIDLLWSVFQDPRLAVVVELYVAARTDADLHSKLEPVAEAHHQHVLGLARQFFPDVATREQFSGAIHLVLDTLQGMAVRKLLRPRDPSIRRTLVLLKQLAAAAAGQES